MTVSVLETVWYGVKSLATREFGLNHVKRDISTSQRAFYQNRDWNRVEIRLHPRIRA